MSCIAFEQPDRVFATYGGDGSVSEVLSVWTPDGRLANVVTLAGDAFVTDLGVFPARKVKAARLREPDGREIG